MKKLLLCSCFLVSSFLVKSQTKLSVILIDGSIQNYDLLSSKLTFSDNENLIIWNNNTMSSTIQLNNIRKVLICEVPNGFIPIQKNQLDIYYFAGKIFIKGLNVNEILHFSIYDIAGHLIFKQDSKYITSINVSFLKSGVYLIIANKQQLKFIK